VSAAQVLTMLAMLALALARPAAGAPVARPISLDLQDADVHGVLRLLAEVGGVDVAVGEEVKGKVTLRLNRVAWDQALEAVLRMQGLQARREGRVLRIATEEQLGRERDAARAASDADRERAPLRLVSLPVRWARADDALAEKVQGVLSERGSVTFDARTNAILVRDLPDGLRDAEALVRNLDVPAAQVLIESSIVEATEDFARGLGVQWGYRYTGGPATGTPTGANFPGTIGVGGGVPPSDAGTTSIPFLADFPVPASFGSGFGPGAAAALDLALGSLNDLAVRLTALEEAGKGKVISRPRVVTMNNVAATIQSLTILRVKLPSTGTVINTGTGGAAETANTATEKINTGITLVVIPQVSSDGFVLLNIYAKSSVPDFSRTVEGIPTEIAREANSNVLVRDGQTVVLGGISRTSGDDRETGVPFFRRVPVLGWFFKRNLASKRREELLVFLTPHLLGPGSLPQPSAAALWASRPGGSTR
jgi:type IV pilus assembly protein PilQ